MAIKKKWLKQQLWIFSTKYPEIPIKELKQFLSDEFDKTVKDKECVIDNNYIHMNKRIGILDVFDWIEEAKPIIAGHGVFFNNQEKAPNPSAKMLQSFLSSRKAFKDKLKIYKEGSYEYQRYDRLQLSEKIGANSYYGAGGNAYSFFYNLYTATSVTSTGQSLISTTAMAFEQFLTNSVWFMDLDDMWIYIYNICNEVIDEEIETKLLPDIPRERLVKEFIEMFDTFYDPNYEKEIVFAVNSLSQKMVNRIFFKNNIYQFSLLGPVKETLIRLFENVTTFKDPNKIPPEIENELFNIWDLYSTFVLYNHFTMDRIDRLKTHRRKTVVVVDTDS